jgi:2-polyprenyl-3-methyl-5-hydroxy-6-metoxy-1,4-benzoquinol methylase
MKTILDVQKYWNDRPCNVRHSPAPVGSPDWIIETEQRKRKVEPHIAEFAKYDQWFGSRVLEIGCGIGIDTVAFARTGARVTAIDLSEESIKLARKRAELAKVTVDFRQMNAENLEWAALFLRRAFDLVYAFGSIHHSPDPEQIIIGARKCMGSGGALKIMVYNKWSWKSLWVLLKYGHGKFWKFRELIAKYSEAQTGCPVTHVYSPRELREMLERNGFVVRKMYKDHIFKFDVEDYKTYKYTVAQPWKWMPAKMFRWFERHFGWHLLCEATC